MCGTRRSPGASWFERIIGTRGAHLIALYQMSIPSDIGVPLPQSADQAVVARVFQDFLDENYPGETADDVFELFCARQVLKSYDLDEDQLAAGIVDGSRDGGIDSFYVLLDGVPLNIDDPQLIPGDPSIKNVPMKSDLQVFILQSKNTEGWSEVPWEKLLASLSELLDVSAVDSELEKIYNSSVVERTGLFRKAVISLGSRFPQHIVKVIYLSRGDDANVSAGMRGRRDQVRALVKTKVTSAAVVEADHYGASKLYELGAYEPSKPGKLKFKQLIRETDAFVGVATLEDFLAFVRSDAGDLRQEFFDSNVRDFEGDHGVNASIKSTLSIGDAGTEFWWLNNGVTVLGDDVDGPQNTLDISRPLIVNGLQTTHVIHAAQREGLLSPETLQKSVLVRVVKSENDEVRDAIIAGTNRQTNVTATALYATQKLQRDIERYLVAKDWFYERRKNHYRNLGKPAGRIITMSLLSQAMISLALVRPDDARARPTTLLGKRPEQIFSEKFAKDSYRVAIEVVKEVDRYLKSAKAKAILDDYSNTRFYVVTGSVGLALKAKAVDQIKFSDRHHQIKLPLGDSILNESLTVLQAVLATYEVNNPTIPRDAIFKGSDFKTKYFAALLN